MNKKFNRRQFLRGAGGTTLAIPFLPSLVRDAYAQNSISQKCFVAIGNFHGNITGSSMYPDPSLLVNTMNYAGRDILYGDLSASVVDGKRRLCEVLSADENVFTEALMGKFNVIRGLDVTWYMGHHNGHLGNYRGVGPWRPAGADYVPLTDEHNCRSIDQVIAWSDTFYPDLSQVTQRSVALGEGNALSHNYASPSTLSGNMQYLKSYSNNLEIFDYFFDPGRSMSGVDTFIVDKILGEYNRLYQGSRISSGDKMRLEQHMERIYEIERQLTAVPSTTPDRNLLYDNASIKAIHGGLDFRIDPSLQAAYVGLINDMLVAAMSAGVCRVGTMDAQGYFFTTHVVGNYHAEVGHGGPDNAVILDQNRGAFAHIMVDLAAKMDDTDMGNGTTMLDNALIMWVNEASQLTHEQKGLPVITAGGAGGFFNTGKFLDLRNMNISYSTNDGYPEMDTDHPGLLYNQFLGTVLQSMGLDPSEYEDFTDLRTGAPVGGYGLHIVPSAIAADYVEAEAVMGEALPIIT